MNAYVAIMLLPGLVTGLTFHEFAHAWSASLLGDDFARRQGRVSLNPFRHLSLLGTLAIFLLPIGWAKPVPVNLYNFKRPKRDYLITSLAGPAANLVVVAVLLGLMQLTRHSYAFGAGGVVWLSLAHHFLIMGVLINTILAVINLLPIPPLDGSKIWPCVIPGLKPTLKPRTTLVFVVILIVLLQANGLDGVFDVAIGAALHVVPTNDADVVAIAIEDAEAAIGREEFAEAEALCTRALSIHPDSTEALDWRSSARSFLDDWAGALADQSRYMELTPYHWAEDYEWRASILEELGRSEEAAIALEMAEAAPRATSQPVEAASP